MQNQDRETRTLAAVAVAAFAGVALATFSVIATQPQAERATDAATRWAVAPVAGAQDTPAFIVPNGVAAPADGEVFEYY